MAMASQPVSGVDGVDSGGAASANGATSTATLEGKLSVVGAASALWEESGGSIAPFFYGVGSRAVWAGCVIAGQFFLYDVFKVTVRNTSISFN